jgi:RimJ/RimL family protein N-acetyltransferase
MIQLETDRLVLKKGRPTCPTPAEIAADYQRYVIEFEDPNVTLAQYQDVILAAYYGAKEGGPFGYYVLFPKGSDSWIGHCPLIPRLCTPDEIVRFRPTGVTAPPYQTLPYQTLPYQTLEVEIGWALSIYHRHQGFATEAARALLDYGFQTLKVQRMVAFTERENQASIKVMQRLGMVVDLRPDTNLVVGCIENVLP